MGSGLILLLLVGAWLAVLVPMALRSHEASSALGTVDKFHDAMRVLSRRDGVARAAQRAGRAGGGRPGAGARGAGVPAAAPVAEAAAARYAVPWRHAGAPRSVGAPVRAGLPPAARRRRALVVLVAAALVTLVGGVLGPSWLLVPHALADLLLVAFLLLRALAVARARRDGRGVAAPRRAADRPRPAVSSNAVLLVPPRHVAGIPDRMPSRGLLDGRWVSVPTARTPAAAPARTPAVAPARTPAVAPARTPAVAPAAPPEIAPARGAQGQPWQPVPVPVPTYVSAPRAPRLPHPATRDDRADDGGRVLPADGGGAQVDVVPERRRAVGD